jgi:hypothetical protein
MTEIKVKVTQERKDVGGGGSVLAYRGITEGEGKHGVGILAAKMSL